MQRTKENEKENKKEKKTVLSSFCIDVFFFVAEQQYMAGRFLSYICIRFLFKSGMCIANDYERFAYLSLQCSPCSKPNDKPK